VRIAKLVRNKEHGLISLVNKEKRFKLHEEGQNKRETS
jgi:hypothetical protein